MTDEQIAEIFNAHTLWNGSHRMLDDVAIARAIIEAAAPEIRRVDRERIEAVIAAYPHWIGPQAKADICAAIRSLPDAA
jgi:hypothetical protein